MSMLGSSRKGSSTWTDLDEWRLETTLRTAVDIYIILYLGMKIEVKARVDANRDLNPLDNCPQLHAFSKLAAQVGSRGEGCCELFKLFI